MEDATDKLDHLMYEFESTTNTLKQSLPEHKRIYFVEYRKLTAVDIVNLLLEHDATVTFAATSAPDATFDSDYEWHIDEHDGTGNWRLKASAWKVGDKARILDGTIETVTKIDIWDDGDCYLYTVKADGTEARRYGIGPKAPRRIAKDDGDV